MTKKVLCLLNKSFPTARMEGALGEWAVIFIGYKLVHESQAAAPRGGDGVGWVGSIFRTVTLKYVPSCFVALSVGRFENRKTSNFN